MSDQPDDEPCPRCLGVGTTGLGGDQPCPQCDGRGSLAPKRRAGRDVI